MALDTKEFINRLVKENYTHLCVVPCSFAQKDSSKNKYFKPELSSKNIGMWKIHSNQKEIDYIYSELKEYCYD